MDATLLDFGEDKNQVDTGTLAVLEAEQLLGILWAGGWLGGDA